MLKDETGKRFGRLTVIKRASNYRDGTARWVCRCDCGKRATKKGSALRAGVVLSCGCLSIEAHTKHSRCFTPEYKSWQSMKDRCHNPNSKDFAKYGGRGITVCAKWRNSFSAFYADMGPRRRGQSIERMNNKLGYKPGNCKWASPLEQSNNTRTTHKITINEKTMSISAWAREIGISSCAFRKRLKKSSDPSILLSARTDSQRP